jgi:hypothetical protein
MTATVRDRSRKEYQPRRKFQAVFAATHTPIREPVQPLSNKQAENGTIVSLVVLASMGIPFSWKIVAHLERWECNLLAEARRSSSVKVN